MIAVRPMCAHVLTVVFFCLPLIQSVSEPLHYNDLAIKLSVRRAKTSLELTLEDVIDSVYRRCLRTYQVAGTDLILRIPFGQGGERRGSNGFYQEIFLGGKGEPEKIWIEIEKIFKSPEFSAYLEKLQRPGVKTVYFNLEQKLVSVFTDPVINELMKEGPYPGTRTRVYVLKNDSGISAADVYNFLYCVGAVGMDCSGFIYTVQRAIAAAFFVELDHELAAVFGIGAENLSGMIGLWFFDPASSFSESVEDRIENLRPGDVILFRGRVPGRGIWFRHSAVIQSIDFTHGLIRYLQCTDWAPENERGVHDSWIRFDTATPQISLGNSSLEWSQTVQPTFAGEIPLRYWRNDGDRYCSYQQSGGSLIVRLKIIKNLIEAVQPDFYENVY